MTACADPARFPPAIIDKASVMQHINVLSYALTALGLALTVGGSLLHINPTITLLGLMLVVAGLIKIAAVALWRGVGGFGAPLGAADDAASNRAKDARSADRQVRRRTQEGSR